MPVSWEHQDGPCAHRRELLSAAAVLLAAVQAPRPARAQEPGPPAVALEGKPATGEAASITAVPAPAADPAGPADTTSYAQLADGLLAYEFQYPTALRGQPLPIIQSRRPERYSSAAPLTADARQRIVAELVDFRDNVTISVSVGPASGTLKGRGMDEWTPKQVADTVLIDRSTARVSSGQRVSLHQIESAMAESRNGQPYFVYEHIAQGSPSIRSADRENYRRAWSVTATRPGLNGTPYLYTLTLSCPDEQWGAFGEGFRHSQASFRLTPPTQDYVPPDKDPWRFF
ncbi:hypothetical protein WJX81_006041 [Elliptochloris bilobata]|uniref:PsbP C-terminal domain-containing protein n=1 Tax=Elliptochloris bilobata TaxID=381761 RepID=A0AAW1SA45_9CHLO